MPDDEPIGLPAPTDSTATDVVPASVRPDVSQGANVDVREAKNTLAREIADNKNVLAQHFRDWDRSTDNVDKALTLANDLLTTKKSDINQIQLESHLSSLSDASWRTAERTGALTYMDYSDVQYYAKLYGYQDLYVSQ